MLFIIAILLSSQMLNVTLQTSTSSPQQVMYLGWVGD